jgi:uncharacterized membrane protein/mono/diheme cytochrome c family protein
VSRSSSSPSAVFSPGALTVVGAGVAALAWPALASGDASTSVPLPVALLGRLHFPLLHFPLVLVFAVLAVEVFGGTRLQPQARRDFGAVLLNLGAVLGVATAISGLAYAQGEEPGGAMASTFAWHRAAGLLSATLLVVLVALRRAADDTPAARAFRPLLVVAAVVVTATGHWGGELVHGEGFLTKPLRRNAATPAAGDGTAKAHTQTDGGDDRATDAPRADGDVEVIAARERWPEGPVPEQPDYAKDIRPIFERSCVKCHGPEKRKSGLRLDQKRFAMKGGENGPALVPGDVAKSSVYTSCSAPPDDEDVMPPKGKLLAQSEIATLKRWIEQGAPWPDEATP